MTSSTATPSAVPFHSHSKKQILSYTTLAILSISIKEKDFVLCEVRTKYLVLFY